MASWTRSGRWVMAGSAAAVLVAACAQGVADRPESDDDSGAATSTTSGAASGGGGEGGGGTSSTGGQGGEGGTPLPCSEDPCKLTLPQCGCPPGDKCTLAGTNRTCTLDGTKSAGELCSGDECKAGTMCVTWGSAFGAASSCKTFCTTDAECSPPGGRCALNLQDSAMNVLASLCSENCDPISNAGCASGLACGAFAAPEGSFTGCHNPGALTQGTSCANIDDCAVGHSCVEIDGVKQCARYCNVAAPSCPGVGAQCLSFNPPLLIGSIQYGVCYTP